ncbi:MAG: CPBP family intramembrane metalloprotease [Ignavibacteria bacterium]|nr:CPBP family intramembrane metalloprotease [Ignavibacteria bacterium]MBT8381524.1 CPBP family intramembrane metalloprotease [Ignavibacteria bacterium]MBT8391348.1 CPBP family intramembrane metalloprotease [Ignavibacteria bacterium]NNJ53018.1 CPBP family intramembrane metalloprotease [Ignavibacteriaceae bacterium]NNL21467.1 CPBP family intramembrane metalloprotease [Ignavibacteriaceae bacterium]
MSDLLNNPDPEENESSKQQESNYEYIPESPYPLISPVAAAFLGLIGGFILYQFAGGLLTLLIFGFDIEAAPVNGLRLMTMAGQILFLLLPALLFAKWIYGNVSEVISLKLPNWKEVTFFTFGIIILTPLLQSYLYIQNYFIEQWAASSDFINSIKSILDSLNELIEKTFGNLLSADTIPEMLLVVLVVAIVPALSEELMFRGYIQRSFEFKLKPFHAALITAIFFSLFHFNPYGILPLAALGLYFGFAAYMSKSLVIPVFLHFLNNFFAVMLYFSIGDDELITGSISDVEALDSNILFFFVLSGLFSLLIFFIRNYYLKSKTTLEN